MTDLKFEDYFGDETDPAEFARVNASAYDRFGDGAAKVSLTDLGARLDVARAILRLPPSVWDDQTVAHVMFGGDEARAGQTISKVKHGTIRFNEWASAMLAGLLNYILCVQPVCDREVSPAQRLDIVRWIGDPAQLEGNPALLSASHVVGDLLAFTARVLALADAHDVRPRNRSAMMAAQGALFGHLLSPLDFAVRDQRLVIERARTRRTERTRFGTRQAAGVHPRQWRPIELMPGDRVDVGIPRRAWADLRGWLLTIRDGMGVADEASVEPATATEGWAWDEGWENTVRWSPGPLHFASGADIAVPREAFGEIAPVSGRFHLFLLVEPAKSDVVRKLLDAPAKADAAHVPDEVGFRRLLIGLKSQGEQSELRLFTGSYVVAGGG